MWLIPRGYNMLVNLILSLWKIATILQHDQTIWSFSENRGYPKMDGWFHGNPINGWELGVPPAIRKPPNLSKTHQKVTIFLGESQPPQWPKPTPPVQRTPDRCGPNLDPASSAPVDQGDDIHFRMANMYIYIYICDYIYIYMWLYIE